jgi:hypothetical protein
MNVPAGPIREIQIVRKLYKTHAMLHQTLRPQTLLLELDAILRIKTGRSDYLSGCSAFVYSRERPRSTPPITPPTPAAPAVSPAPPK